MHSIVLLAIYWLCGSWAGNAAESICFSIWVWIQVAGVSLKKTKLWFHFCSHHENKNKIRYLYFKNNFFLIIFIFSALFENMNKKAHTIDPWKAFWQQTPFLYHTDWLILRMSATKVGDDVLLKCHIIVDIQCFVPLSLCLSFSINS